MDYECRYCDDCVHNHKEWGCPCWNAHVLWSNDECNNKESVLHKMIPRDEDGSNMKCFCHHLVDDRVNDYSIKAKYEKAMKEKRGNE